MKRISRALFALLLAAAFAFTLLGAVSCGGGDDDDDDASGDDVPDDDSLDDDAGDDDTADDDVGDDDTDGNDDDTTDDDHDLPLSCDEGGVFTDGDVTIRRLAGATPGQNGLAMAYRPQDDRVYIAATSSRELMLYSRPADAASEGPWDKLMIDCMAADPDMVIDTDGYFHIVYGDLWTNELVYATNRGGWTKEVIEYVGSFEDAPLAESSHSFSHAAITTDDEGAPHVVYHRIDSGQAAYAKRDESGWVVESIDEPRSINNVFYIFGVLPDVEVDADGRVHVMYYGQGDIQVDEPFLTRRFIHQYQENGEWVWEQVPALLNPTADFSDTAALTRDESGKIFVAFRDDDELTIGAWDNGNWKFEKPADFPAVMGPVAIAVGADGDVQVIFVDDENLYFSRQIDGEWDSAELVATLDEPVEFPSLAVDTAGTAHFAVYQDELYVGSNKSTATTLIVPVTQWMEGRTGSILTIGDEVHAVYQDGRKIVHWALIDGKVETRTIDQWSDPDLEFNADPRSLYADSDGTLHFVYSLSESIPEDFRYAIFKDQTWSVTSHTVPDASELGIPTILGIDDNNHVVVIEADYDPDPSLIKILYFSDSGISINTASTQWVFSQTGITATSDGAIHLFYDRSSDILHLTNADSSWIDAAEDPIQEDDERTNFPDALASTNDTLNITYCGGENGSLLTFVTGVTGNWNIETILGGTVACRFPSLALDTNDHAHIVLYQTEDDNFVSFSNESGEWAFTILDHAGTIAPTPTQSRYFDIRPSLALGIGNNIHALYSMERGTYLLEIEN
ncbi:MAG: hypothetical protein H6685_00780 [Deltaproteobacteria bacterium]|nr:hypothetical protein [Deltaproteobacteria bacterium]